MTSTPGAIGFGAAGLEQRLQAHRLGLDIELQRLPGGQAGGELAEGVPDLLALAV